MVLNTRTCTVPYHMITHFLSLIGCFAQRLSACRQQNAVYAGYKCAWLVHLTCECVCFSSGSSSSTTAAIRCSVTVNIFRDGFGHEELAPRLGLVLCPFVEFVVPGSLSFCMLCFFCKALPVRDVTACVLLFIFSLEPRLFFVFWGAVFDQVL